MSQDERIEAAAKAIATSDGWQHPAPRHFKQATAALAAADRLAPDTAASALADELQKLCCAETEGKFFDCVTDNIQTILVALRRKAPDTAAAVEAERERCAKIAKGWLATFGGYKPVYVSAQTWATDGVKDIIDGICNPGATIRKAGPA